MEFIHLTNNKYIIPTILEIKKEVFKEDSTKDDMLDLFDKVWENQGKELYYQGRYYDDIDYMLIYDSGVVVGMIGYYTRDKVSGEYWVGWFGILPEYRNQGYGKLALEKLFRYLFYIKKASILRVYTGEKENKEACKLYEGQGFIKQEDKYKDDIVIYSKNLAHSNVSVSPWIGEPLW